MPFSRFPWRQSHTWIRWLNDRWWTRATAVAVAIALVAATVLTALLTRANTGPAVPPARHQQVIVAGMIPPVVARAKRVGRMDAGTRLQLSIGLRLTHRNDLKDFVANLENPHSSQYHHYLSPQAFADKYSPSAADATAVANFLRAAGLRVTGIAPNRLLIDASGSVGQVEQALGITIGRYQLGNTTYFAPDRDPMLPDNIAPLVQNIGGLDSFFRMTSHVRIGHPGQTPIATPAASSGASPRAALQQALAPADVRSAYDVAPLLTALNANHANGYGNVAVFELAPYIPTDINTFRSTYSLPAAAINNVSVDGGAVTCAGSGSACDVSGVAEADLDVEMVAGLAPNATQYVYAGPNTNTGVNDTYTRIVNDNAAHVITTSWGVCEPFAQQNELTVLDNIFLQAKTHGQTIFAAAGDSGSDDCQGGGDTGFGMPPAVDAPASDPNVVGVGGTSLTMTGIGTSGAAYGSEMVWNDSYGAGGGGLSSYFSQPAWQSGAGTSNAYSVGQRQVPDVAADADVATGYAIYCTSAVDCGSIGWLQFGGTSAAAPLWAAIYDDMDAYFQPSHAGSPIGWVNQKLYQLMANSQTHTPYHDVTAGNNDFDYTTPPFQGDYPAGACYDLTTGVGTPDAWNIAQDISAGVQTGGGGLCPASTTTTTNLIQDGGFENIGAGLSSPWQTFSLRGNHVITSNGPRGGSLYSFQACQSPGCDDRVWQSVTVPAVVHTATLSFWVQGLTTWLYLTSTPPCLDHFYVTLATPDGTVFDAVQATCKMYAFGYMLESIPVTSALQAHQGQQVIVQFRATNTNLAPAPGYYSYWFVDDVALNVS